MTTDGAPILTTRKLFKRFSPRPEDEVLRGLDMTVRAGEVLAIAGPSGVGKSTLLNILGLLDQPSAGDIRYMGRESRLHDRNLADLPGAVKARMRNRIFGFVFQLYHLLPDLSVRENVMLPLLIDAPPLGYFAAKRKARIQAERLLEEVGIAPRAHARPRELSGGEKQRAAIARALVAAPEIVLCDEPTGNLDTATSEKIHALLRRLNREHRVTFVIVTHDTALAGRADRTLHMIDGRFV